MKLSKVPAPFPFSLTGGPFYEGRLFEGGVDKGSVTLAWVSKFFRRATLEIDTLVGAVRPAPVPDGAGGTEFFDTVFAKTGWQLAVVQDQLNVPVPSGVVATNCWSSADLHALMTDRAQSRHQSGHRMARAHDRRAREARLLARRHVRPDRRSPRRLRQLLR